MAICTERLTERLTDVNGRDVPASARFYGAYSTAPELARQRPPGRRSWVVFQSGAARPFALYVELRRFFSDDTPSTKQPARRGR